MLRAGGGGILGGRRRHSVTGLQKEGRNQGCFAKLLEMPIRSIAWGSAAGMTWMEIDIHCILGRSGVVQKASDVLYNTEYNGSFDMNGLFDSSDILGYRR